MSDSEPMTESAAIKAVGSLFKITEVSLWDVAKVSFREDFNSLYFGTEPDISGIMTVANSSIKNEITDFTSLEDLELAEEMHALGLPISFRTTNQHKNSISIKGKKKVINTEDASSYTNKENIIPGSPRNCIVDEKQPKVHCKKDTPLMNPEIVYNGMYTQGVDDVLVIAIEKQIGDNEIDVNLSKYAEDDCLESLSVSCLINGDNIYDDVGKDIDYHSTSECFEYGEWRVIWDPYYERNYFYNIQSTESTWYPPQGLESFAASTSESDVAFDMAEEESAVSLNKLSEETVVYAHSNNHENVNKIPDVQCSLYELADHSPDEFDIECWDKQERQITCSEACSMVDATLEPLENYSLSSTVIGRDKSDDSDNSQNMGGTYLTDELKNTYKTPSKKKKNNRVRRQKSQHSLQEEGELPAHILKYWHQRYLLFSRFDYGIKMDEEGWFSVTPESIARHHAVRCGSGIIVDCFTGVGGNAIQFALMGNHVIAIDIDSMRIDYAEQNAAVYGVNDQINFIIGDFFQIAPRLKADVIFMSPPWGGPEYSKVETYDVNTMLKPCDGQHLFEIAKTVASKVVMFLPRNADINQLADISISVDPPWALEIEKNILNGRLKAITAYFTKPTL